MITGRSQRWRDGTSRWAARRALFDPAAHAVEAIARDAEAKHFVERHHYSGTFPAARARFGLRDRSGALVGVAVFSVPAQPRAIDNWFALDRDEVVDFGRLVLLDEVGYNAESWFVARCFEALRRAGYGGVLSFADPEPRTTARGDVVFTGHVGQIYQALGAVYTGRSKAEERRLLPDGTVLPGRALAKIRNRERGWRYASERLRALGADEVWDDAAAWVRHWVPRLTRSLRHGGNHRYLWGLTAGARRDVVARARRRLGELPPYPRLAR